MTIRPATILVCATAAVLLCAAVARGGGPAPRALNVPAEWLTFEIDWKPTWDETLKAHPINTYSEELKKRGLSDSRWQIGRLRWIALLEAMMKRWPRQRDKHIEAYVEIGQMYYQMGRHWWHSYWGYKLVKDFPENPAAVQRGYQMVLTWGFGQYTHWGWFGYWVRPECRDWEFAIDEIIARHTAGTLADGQAVRTAYSFRTWMDIDFVNYGRFHQTLALQKLNKKDPSFGGMADHLLKQFGHNQLSDRSGVFFDQPPGVREAYFELRTRWEAAQHSDLFRDVDTPVDVARVQKLLDLISVTDAHLRQGERYTPYWTLLDRRLTALPAHRLKELRSVQNEAAKRLAWAAEATGDGSELIAAFRRYPLAACLHELMILLAERDLRKGLTHWSTPVLWDVVKHTDDPKTRTEACLGLWLALSQSAADRPELDTAMQLVPDDQAMTWRGQRTTARAVKEFLRAGAPTDTVVRSVTLAELRLRRIHLPRDWPARQRNLDGPAGALGMHAPWPVSQIEPFGRSLVVSGPTAVARYDAGTEKPAWVYHPPQRISNDAWPWSVEGGRPGAISGFNTWRADRRPVRTRRQAPGPLPARLYYLMNTVEPPIVVALDALGGQIAWSTESAHGWDGMEPLSHPTVRDGRVYVLAAPPDPRTKNWVNYPRVQPATVHLVCLDAAVGRVLWKRPIGWLQEAHLDLAHGSAPVIAREGSIYCATNAGLLARCGGQDGILQWVHTYPIAVHQLGRGVSINPQREGTRPVIVRPTGAGQAGSVILTAPRDHTGVLAFSYQTGKRLWETPLTPSDKLVGATGVVVVGINHRWLSALQLTTGEQLYCREFPAGTNSTAALIGPDVILITDRVLHRIRAATGKTIETRRLEGTPDAEFTILPDGTVVQVLPPPLSPAPGPSTVGRKLTLPMEKVWSVPCESPRVIFREDPNLPVKDFAVVSGRRIGYVQRDPTWRMAWDRLLPRPPQAAALVGKSVLTADLWTVSGMGLVDGANRWATKVRILPAMLGGRDRYAYGASVGSWGGTPHYAMLDSDTGKLLWSRNLSRGWMHAPQATVLRKEADGSYILRALMGLAKPEAAKSGFGEVQVDAATGKITSVRLAPPGAGFWGLIDYDRMGYAWYLTPHRWVDPGNRALAVAWDGTDASAAWKRRLDLNPTRWHSRRVGVDYRPSGVYARMDGYVLGYDPATGKEVRYRLTRPGDVIQPFIFDLRADGDRLIVVSGYMHLLPPEKNKRSPSPTSPEKWQMFVDVFDRATGKPLGRQQLPGVRCCVTYVSYQTMAGYETQVRILEDSIVISDIHGVHVFASRERIVR